MLNKPEWQWEIKAKRRWFDWNLSELWHYKDLLRRFVRRDLIANYQQTLLGPLWIFLQPILTTLVYWIIFGKVARISTEGISPILFYLPGIIIWSYFSDCLHGAMYTFLQNATMFEKIYFPRLIVPISSIATHTVRMLVQLLVFAIIYGYSFFTMSLTIPGISILVFPVLILITAAFSLGLGLVISVVTARYRDLDYALQFILRLFMFATPIVYPASLVPAEYKFLYWLNPLTAVVETFRSIFFSNNPIEWSFLLLSGITTLILLFTGITLFKKWELKVMDIL